MSHSCIEGRSLVWYKLWNVLCFVVGNNWFVQYQHKQMDRNVSYHIVISHPHTITPSHHHIITPSHHHTITHSHPHTIIPSPHHTLTLSHHHTITPSHSHTITPSHPHTIIPSPHHTLTPSHHHTLTLSHHHALTPSHHHTLTPSHILTGMSSSGSSGWTARRSHSSSPSPLSLCGTVFGLAMLSASHWSSYSYWRREV